MYMVVSFVILTRFVHVEEMEVNLIQKKKKNNHLNQKKNENGQLIFY